MSDVAREIIDQYAPRPGDRPTLLCLCIHGTTTHASNTRTELMRIGAPIVKGEAVLEIRDSATLG